MTLNPITLIKHHACTGLAKTTRGGRGAHHNPAQDRDPGGVRVDRVVLQLRLGVHHRVPVQQRAPRCQGRQQAGKAGSCASLSPQRRLASMPGKPDVSPVILPSPPADARLHCAACAQSSSTTPHSRGAERFVQPAVRTAEDIRFCMRMRGCAPQLSGSPCRAGSHRGGPWRPPRPVCTGWAR